MRNPPITYEVTRGGKTFKVTRDIDPEYMRKIGKKGYAVTEAKLKAMMNDPNADPDDVIGLMRFLHRRIRLSTDTYRKLYKRVFNKGLRQGIGAEKAHDIASREIKGIWESRKINPKEALGRVDYKPKLKVWRVIWYKGKKDVNCGDYPTKELAEEELRKLVRSTVRSRKNPTITRFSKNVEYIGVKTDYPLFKISGDQIVKSITIQRFFGRPYNWYDHENYYVYTPEIWNKLVGQIKQDAKKYGMEVVNKDEQGGYAYIVPIWKHTKEIL